MNVYVYKADVYCADCGEEIRALIASGIWDGTLPVQCIYVKSEAQTPQDCAGCGVILENLAAE